MSDLNAVKQSVSTRVRLRAFCRATLEGVIWSLPLLVMSILLFHFAGNMRMSILRALLEAAPISLVWGLSAGIVGSIRGRGITSRRGS